MIDEPMGCGVYCTNCLEEFKEEDLFWTNSGEALCEKCFRGHPENPNSERIIEKEVK